MDRLLNRLLNALNVNVNVSTQKHRKYAHDGRETEDGVSSGVDALPRLNLVFQVFIYETVRPVVRDVSLDASEVLWLFYLIHKSTV